MPNQFRKSNFVNARTIAGRARKQGYFLATADWKSFARESQKQNQLVENGIRLGQGGKFWFSEAAIQPAIRWAGDVRQKIQNRQMVPLTSLGSHAARVQKPGANFKQNPPVHFDGKTYIPARIAREIRRHSESYWKTIQQRRGWLSLSDVRKMAEQKGIHLSRDYVANQIKQKKVRSGAHVFVRPKKRFFVDRQRVDAFLREAPKMAIPPAGHVTSEMLHQDLQRRGTEMSQTSIHQWMKSKSKNWTRQNPVLEGIVQDVHDPRHRYFFSPQNVQAVGSWALALHTAPQLEKQGLLVRLSKLAQETGLPLSSIQKKIGKNAAVIGQTAYVGKPTADFFRQNRSGKKMITQKENQLFAKQMDLFLQQKGLPWRVRSALQRKLRGFYNSPFREFVSHHVWNELFLQLETSPRLSRRIVKNPLAAPLDRRIIQSWKPRFKPAIVLARLQRLLPSYGNTIDAQSLAFLLSLPQKKVRRIIDEWFEPRADGRINTEELQRAFGL